VAGPTAQEERLHDADLIEVDHLMTLAWSCALKAHAKMIEIERLKRAEPETVGEWDWDATAKKVIPNTRGRAKSG
jgi:hypothetical protein